MMVLFYDNGVRKLMTWQNPDLIMEKEDVTGNDMVCHLFM